MPVQKLRKRWRKKWESKSKVQVGLIFFTLFFSFSFFKVLSELFLKPHNAKYNKKQVIGLFLFFKSGGSRIYKFCEFLSVLLSSRHQKEKIMTVSVCLNVWNKAFYFFFNLKNLYTYFHSFNPKIQAQFTFGFFF